MRFLSREHTRLQRAARLMIAFGHIGRRFTAKRYRPLNGEKFQLALMIDAPPPLLLPVYERGISAYYYLSFSRRAASPRRLPRHAHAPISFKFYFKCKSVLLT